MTISREQKIALSFSAGVFFCVWGCVCVVLIINQWLCYHCDFISPSEWKTCTVTVALCEMHCCCIIARKTKAWGVQCTHCIVAFWKQQEHINSHSLHCVTFTATLVGLCQKRCAANIGLRRPLFTAGAQCWKGDPFLLIVQTILI